MVIKIELLIDFLLNDSKEKVKLLNKKLDESLIDRVNIYYVNPIDSINYALASDIDWFGENDLYKN